MRVNPYASPQAPLDAPGGGDGQRRRRVVCRLLHLAFALLSGIPGVFLALAAASIIRRAWALQLGLLLALLGPIGYYCVVRFSHRKRL